MEQIISHLDQLYGIAQIPMFLLDTEGHALRSWPESARDFLAPTSARLTILDFQLQKRGAGRPIINFFEPGFLMGMAELAPERYLLVGLVSPYIHTREDILNMAAETVPASQLQAFCDMMIRQPPVYLQQLKGALSLVERLMGREVGEEQILFVDNVAMKQLSATHLDQSVFQQREEPEFHVPMDFEQGICDAVEAGNRALLERTLSAPRSGRIGRMSSNELRQEKYAFVCLATLVSRAAIRGGLEPETAFSLSDLYCQRSDVVMEVAMVQSLVYTMLSDFCDKVREAQGHSAASTVIQNCLSYISVHLHESITVQQLSAHVGLCTRSLSLRFRKEMGMGIPEYIHQEKLREAEYLLQRTDYTLSEITGYLNYPSQSYFTQVFKRYRGMTPQQFREQR